MPWWVVPLVIVGLVVLAWLLLAGLPFGRKDAAVEQRPATETIAEGTTTAQLDTAGTVIELPGDNVPGDDDVPATTSTTSPALDTIAPAGTPPPDTPVASPAPTQPPTQPARTTPAPQPARTPTPARTEPAPARTTPAPVRNTPPATRPTPEPVRTPPAAPPVQREAPSGNAEISETEAATTLRGSIGGAYDGVSGDCLQIRSHGYKNVGYTFSVWDSCVSGGGSRMLGRWRVDSKTREVFRQREDGRYLRP